MPFLSLLVTTIPTALADGGGYYESGGCEFSPGGCLCMAIAAVGVIAALSRG